MTIWFDVEDLLHYFDSGNKRVSGIQRVSLEIFRAAKALEAQGGPAIGFVRHGARPPQLIPVAWSDLLSDFEAEAPPEPKPEPQPGPSPPVPAPAPELTPSPALRPLRRLARRTVDRLPPQVRRPLVLAVVMQFQVVGALALFGGQAALFPFRYAGRAAGQAATRLRDAASGLRPKPSPPPRALDKPAPGRFERLSAPGDILLVLGAPWNRERYSDIVRHLRDERRMRFGVLVHDLVPVRHPEWCHRGQPRMFREWYDDVLPVCDVVFANSRHTAADVEAHARENGIVLTGPVRALPVGSGFGGATVEPVTADLPAPGSYALFVSTVEARKNHALLVRVWTRLLEEVSRGERAANSVPDLVFAGRVGWLIADLLGQLDHTCWLGGRIRLVEDPTDAELRALYAGCLFTLFPSWHEGWGLPVTESLALGKPCLSSSAASLPEAGGTLCRYFDPGSVASAYAAIAATLDDRPGLAAWEAQVRREWRPTPWADTVRAILAALREEAERAEPRGE